MKVKSLITLLPLLLCLIGCSTQGTSQLKKWMEPNGKIKVLATIEMIEDLVQAVGGDHVDTTTLVQGELDPHTYQLVKGDDEKLSFAQVIFYNGLSLEHGPSLKNFLKQSQKAYSLGDSIQKKDPTLILRYNGNIDPHIWMDMSLWALAVDEVVAGLSATDPDHSAFYKANGKALKQTLIDKHNKLRQHMLRVPDEKRYLITSHDAFNYFARAYMASDQELQNDDWQKRFAAPEGLSPESQLSTTDIRLIIDHMKKYNIQVIFPESNVNRASIRKLLDAGIEQGMELKISSDHLYGDAMGPPGSNGETYIKMIDYNVKTLAKHLVRNGQKH